MRDLIKRLKHCEENCGDVYLAELVHTAAKKIEELEAQVEMLLHMRGITRNQLDEALKGEGDA